MTLPDFIAANYDERVELGETYEAIGRQAALDGYTDVADYCASKVAAAAPVQTTSSKAPVEQAVTPKG